MLRRLVEDGGKLSSSCLGPQAAEAEIINGIAHTRCETPGAGQLAECSLTG
jgi:hypothetical protein